MSKQDLLWIKKLLNNPIDLYPQATVAAFDPTCGNLPRRQLDERRTQLFLERLAQAGTQAALIASSTGQGHLRTVAELESWFLCAAAAETGSMRLIGLLRPEDGVDACENLMDVLCGSGYPIVFFRPGNDLPADADTTQVADSLAPFVEAAAKRGLAIGLYSISDVSGVTLTPEAVAELMQRPGGDHIVAVKVTEADYEASTAGFLAHTGLNNLKIVQGWDPFLSRALQDGPRFDKLARQRVGITSGMMSLALYQYDYMLQQAQAGNWAELERAQKAVTPLFSAMQDDPEHFADLQRAKYLMGLGQPILGRVTAVQVERLFEALNKVENREDRMRLSKSLDLMKDGPYHQRLLQLYQS